jgi:hypothetical protein
MGVGKEISRGILQLGQHSSVAASQHVAVGRPAHGRSRSKKGASIDAAFRQIELGDRLIEVEIPDNVASELKARKVSHETRAYEVRRCHGLVRLPDTQQPDR